MPRKYSYEEVKSYIESYDGFKLLSDKYINNSTKLKIETPSNEIVLVSFSMFKKGYRVPHKKRTIEEVSEVFKSCNCTLLDNDVKLSDEKYSYICNKHPEITQTTRFDHAKNGHLCRECKKEKLKEVHLLSQEFVFNEFIKRGLIPEDNEKYVSARTPISVRCIHHADEILKITYDNLSSKNTGCKHCFYSSNSGENNCNWKGGITTLANYLRPYTLKWVKSSIEENGYVCALTNQTKNLEVHHLTSFSNILKDTLSKLNMELKPNISDYSLEELTLLKNEIIGFHEENLGIVLNYDVHRLYHKIYGFDNFPEQFREFERDFKNGKYSKFIERGVSA